MFMFKFKKDYDSYINSLLTEHGYASVEEAYSAHPDYEDAELADILNDDRFNTSFKYYSEADEAQDVLSEQIEAIYNSYKEDISDLYIDIDNIERSYPLNKRDELIARKEAEIERLVAKRDAEIEDLKAEFIKNNVDSSSDESTCNVNKQESSVDTPVYFNSNDWELAAPKTYFYKGSNPLYPSTITADDFNLNTLLDECMKDCFMSDNKAFYIKSEPTSDRKNGASKSFMFLKDGSAVYCIDSVSKKMRELSMSAAGGKDGIVSRPYYYISFPLAGKSRQLPLHKILAVFAHAEELISQRNKTGVPLCGLVPNHKDNNGINNNINNLEWVSPDENKLHSSAVELLAMADGGQFKYMVDKEHTPDVWVNAKDQWVIPNRNILNFQLSIKDIYNYLERHHITIAGHSIRAIVNVFDFINYLKSEGIIKEA